MMGDLDALSGFGRVQGHEVLFSYDSLFKKPLCVYLCDR